MGEINSINNIAFRQNVTQTLPEKPETASIAENIEEKNGMSGSEKIMIGLGALAAITTACIVVKNLSKAGKTLKEGAEQTVSKVGETAEPAAAKTEKVAANAEDAAGHKPTQPKDSPAPETDDVIMPSHYGSISEYANSKVVDEINALTVSTAENANKIKDIFLKELGYDTNLINVKFVDDLRSGIQGGMNYLTGEVSFNKELLNSLSPQALAVLVRHELDHFDKAAKLCKSIGVDEYEKIFAGLDEKKFLDYSGKKCVFNKEFWQKASENADIKDFDAQHYQKALNDYLNRSENELVGVFDNFAEKVKYVDNPLEVSAYNIQHSLEKSLNVKPLQTLEYLSPHFNAAEKAVDNLLKRASLSQDKAIIFDALYIKAFNELIQEVPDLQNKHELVRAGIVFEKMVKLAKAGVEPDDIYQAFTQRQASIETTLFARNYDEATAIAVPTQKIMNNPDALASFKTRQENAKKVLLTSIELDRLKKLLGENTESYIKYLEQSKTADSQLLELYYTKIFCESNIRAGSADDAVANIKISDELKNKIFNNETFKKDIHSRFAERPEYKQSCLEAGVVSKARLFGLDISF